MTAFTLSRVFTPRFFSIFLALFLLVAGTEILAQGKSKGRGDNNRGSQRAKRDDQGDGNRKQARQEGVQQAQQQRQRARQQVPQNRGNDRRIQMQQAQQQRQQAQQQVPQNRGNGRRVQTQQAHQQRIQQIQQQREQQAQQRVYQDRGNERRVQSQQQRQLPGWAGRNGGVDRRARIRGGQSSVQPQIIPEQKVRNWFPQANNRASARRIRGGEGRREQMRDRSVFVGRQSPAFSGVWPQNYGQQRRLQVFQRNAERRALRDNRSWANSAPTYLRQQREYAPTYRPRTFYESYVIGYPDPYSYSGGRRSYGDNRINRNYSGFSYGYVGGGYSDPYYDYYDRPSAADIFRNVIFAVLGGGIPANDNYAYSDRAYSDDHYTAYSPQYAGYEGGGYYPAGYSYATNPSYYDPYFYEDPEYAEVLPIQYFAQDMPGGGLFRQLFTHLLAIGYDQGYQDGVAAKSIRERDRVFSDPYAYDNAGYDPYSVSLGDNRRCLGQGYELGYEDAINNIDGYDQFDDGGVDLVSVLIGSVSQLM